MFSKAKILVTGGAGFVGVNLIKRLLDEGADIRATLHHKDPVIKHINVKVAPIGATAEVTIKLNGILNARPIIL